MQKFIGFCFFVLHPPKQKNQKQYQRQGFVLKLIFILYSKLIVLLVKTLKEGPTVLTCWL